MTVMVSVMRSPPKWAFLKRTGTDPCQNELKNPTCFVGFVRKITVIAGCYAEHTHHVKNKAHDQRSCCGLYPNKRQQQQMENHKRDVEQPVRNKAADPEGPAGRR